MKLYLRIVLAAAVVVSAGILTLGCRSIKIEPATIGTEGLRFYRPWPYLWVTSAAGKGCTTRVVWLPRTNQEYAIKTTGVLGSVTFKPVLTDGWNLTSFEGSADSKVPETLGAIAEVASAAVKERTVERAEGILVGLYVFEMDAGTGLVTTLKHIWPAKPAKCSMLVGADKSP